MTERRDRAGDRVADGAVLAHHILVLENDAGAGAVVFGHIGATHQINDLVGLDRTCTRVHRIRPDAREIVDLERCDRAITPDADFPLASVVTGMDVGIEALDPVGDKFDRPSQQFRQRIGRHFVGINMHLDAKGAADVLAYHAHLRLTEAEMQRCDVLHHVRRLGALIDGQPRFRGIPVG